MPSGGDILVVQKEQGDQPFFIDLDVATGDGTKTLVPARTNFSIYIQKITTSIITHANAKQILYQDNAGTPVKIAGVNDLTSAAGVPDVVVHDFGPHGTKLTQDKEFDVVNPSSGPAFRVHVEGYYRPTTLNLTMANTTL